MAGDDNASIAEIQHRADTDPLPIVWDTVRRVLTPEIVAHALSVAPGAEISEVDSVELRGLYEIVLLLSSRHDPSHIRSWFIEPVPDLDDISPADAIFGGRIGAARDAALHWLGDRYNQGQKG